MPTGYTSAIHDGKDLTLDGYLRRCVRAFILDCREEPFNAPLPERSTYKDDVVKSYEEKVQAALDTIYKLEGMTDAACEAEALAEHQATVERLAGYNEEKKALAGRYGQVLDAIDAWTPPQLLHGVRDFMREQIVDSIKFDCDPYAMPAAPQNGAEYRAEQIEHAQRMHANWTAELVKQRAGQKHNNAFMETLHAELRRLDESQAASRPDNANDASGSGQ